MPRLLVEILQVMFVGIVLGGGSIVVRGLPSPRPSPDATTCSAPDPETPTVRWVSRAEAHTFAESPSVVFVDAREREAFESGHIAGAITVPYVGGDVPEGALGVLRAASTVVTYCDTSGGCAASTRLARALVLAGVRDVRVLEGGMPGWLENGYAAEAGPCRNCP